MRRRWRLFPKYALLIATVVGAMLVASGVIGVYFSWRETEANLVALQVEKAESAATRIEQYIVDIAHQISWTGLPAASADGDALEERRFEYLKLFKQSPAITEVAWIDSTGHEQLRISRLAMNTIRGGVDLSQEPKFREASAGRIYYGPVYFRKGTEPYMTIARPAGGGVTAAEVNLKFVWDVVSRIQIGEAGRAYVIDAEGSLIAHPDISLVLRKTDLSLLPQVVALRSPDAKAQSLARGIGGDPVLSAHAPIPTLHWTVFVESPEAEAFAPLYASILRAALLLGAGLLLAMVASFFVARALVRPLQALQEGAARIGAGELDRRIEVKTGDELEGVAEQFNKMGAALKDSYADLEGKVETRTAELREALDYQVAISDVLRVISQSPNDVAPVFEAILDCATRLFGSAVAAVYRYREGQVELIAARNWPDEAFEVARSLYPAAPSKALLAGRVILTGQALSVDDALLDPTYNHAFAQAGAWRRMAGAPMLKDGAPIGAILVAWPDAGATPQRQIDLFKTFADQAVIAIENVRLMNETKEALEQQTATAEILRVISSSPTDVQPVFDAIAERAMVLCGGNMGAATRFDGEILHLVSYRGTSARGEAAMRAAFPMPVNRSSANGRSILDRAPVQIVDVRSDPEYLLKDAADLSDWISCLSVPLLHEGRAIGALAAARPEPGPFPEKSIALLETFARQAVIAIENVRLFNETREALEQQTATAEVLRVISRSQTDVQPVFDTIAAAALRLCEATSANVVTFDGTLVHVAALASVKEEAGDAVQAHFATYPRPPSRGTANTRAILTRSVVMIPDVLQDPDYAAGSTAVAAGYRSILATPLMNGDQALGAITVARPVPGPLPDKQVSLLRTFADQAVIAIANVRLFNETKEALERQTATAEILKVIASSPADVQPVFDAIADSSNRLMAGLSTAVFLIIDDTLHLKAFTRISDEADALLKAAFPLPLGTYPAGAQLRQGNVVQLTDVEVDWAAYPKLIATARKRGFRSVLWSPLMREGVAVGMISVTRVESGSFAPHHVELLQTFADQAVIAIENVRLFNEIQEGLRQQTAIASVLKVISQSTFDLQRVLTTLVDNATLLCDASHGFIFRPDGAVYRLAVARGASPEFEAHIAHIPVRPERGFLIGRTVLDKRPVQILDALADPDYSQAESQRLGGYRTMLGVPMLSGNAVVGVIVVWRQEVRAFTDKQVELLTTFADQAVIAIENVRLFNETNEALERQTATAEVLKVISASPTDVQPVLRAVAERAGLLCKSEGSRVWLLVAGDKLRAMAEYGPRLGGEDELPLRRSSIVGRAFLERRLLHVEDVVPTIETEYPDVREMQARLGFRTVLAVPMLRDGQPIGVITLLRRWVQPFPEADVNLVRTFADQAVIAIENVRLFNETREALERQTATAEILRVISASMTEAQPVFDVIAERAARLTGATLGFVFRFDGEWIHVTSAHGMNQEGLNATRKAFPMRPGDGSATARAVRDGVVVNIGDVHTDTGVDPKTLDLARVAGYRAVLAVPMLREHEIVGAIAVTRAEPGLFADREVDLLKTFASQAVIAIENARLFNQTKEALEHQIATSEVLQAISNSVADTAPVFDKILAGCERLFAGNQLMVFLVEDEERLALGAIRGPDPGRIEQARRIFPVPLAGTATEQAIRERRLVTFADVLADPDVPEALRRVAREYGETYAVAVAPMLWEGKAIGSILVGRQELRMFDEKEQRLLRTFADQAVIAIQNARLFNETREALEQQTATAEILRVISSSPTDVQPVFDAIAERAMTLSEARVGAVTRFDGELVHLVAYHGISQQASEAMRAAFPMKPGRGSVSARAILLGVPVQIPDVLADPDYGQKIAAGEANFRSTMAVPMLREGEVVGAISVTRVEPGVFPDRLVRLLQTFASQAVIAIENVRLFNETREALEQQTATAEVLQVISSSVADTQPVFDKILDSSQRLFAATGLGIYLVDAEGMLRKAGFRGVREKPERSLGGTFPRPLEGTVTEQAIRERRVIHYPDVLAVPDAAAASLRRIAKAGGSFSIAFAPMLWEGRGVGAIQVSREPPQPFSDKELALLKTFADQAVIAIQNSRLFDEIQAKSRELEQANKHKSEFLANMSHELRTPLNAIIGFSEVLAEKMFGEVNEKQLEYLLDIHSSGQHLLSLINDILDLSKIEAGRMELDLASTSLPMLLDNCTTLLRERASRQGLVLALEVEPGVADWVADVRKLKQVVINLLSNAVKFTPAGGRVTLRARRLEHAVEIAVIDTGVGIAEDQQALVFEEFRQAGGDYLRKAEGTGLGLSLAKRFVELHGGTMRVESRLGQGSTFAFILPERVVEAV